MMHDELEDMIKDKVLAALIDEMEDRMGGDIKSRHGLAVQVAAPDKEHLEEGLDKAKDVVDQHAPDTASDQHGEEPADDRSDEDRLAELLGGDSEKDEDDDEC